jgi:predicted nucleic acid-binding Zn ribbon protein
VDSVTLPVPDDIDFEPCSYCGAQIPVDIVRCPKCGEYTDGGGTLAGRQKMTPRNIAFLVIAIITVIAFLIYMPGGC